MRWGVTADGAWACVGDNSVTNGPTNCRLWPVVQTATTTRPVNPLRANYSLRLLTCCWEYNKFSNVCTKVVDVGSTVITLGLCARLCVCVLAEHNNLSTYVTPLASVHSLLKCFNLSSVFQWLYRSKFLMSLYTLIAARLRFVHRLHAVQCGSVYQPLRQLPCSGPDWLLQGVHGAYRRRVYSETNYTRDDSCQRHPAVTWLLLPGQNGSHLTTQLCQPCVNLCQ